MSMIEEKHTIEQQMSRNSLMAEAKKLVIQRAKPANQTLVEKFIQCFFDRQDHTDIEKLTPKVVADLIWEAWEHFAQRKLDQAKVEIYELKLPTEQGGSRIVINVVNDNMAFIVDSITAYLSRVNLRARIMLRPIFRVKRDAAGKLEDIVMDKSSDEGTIQESLAHCEITDPLSPDLLKQLKKDIPKIMQDVRLAVNDWHHMRAKVQDSIAGVKPIGGVVSPDQVAEVIDFLQWLDNDHFTFLGYREYKLEKTNGTFEPVMQSNTHLGLLSDDVNKDLGMFYKGKPLSGKTLDDIFESNPLVVTKTTRISTVHRPVPLDSISIKIFDADGNVVGLRQFLGLFTSVAYSSSTRDIPLLRRKVSRVLERSGVLPQWHDGKALVHILDSLPRDELFQASEKELQDIGLKVLSIQEQPKIALFIRRDHFDRFLSCLVYVPRDRFEYSLTEKISDILKDEFDGTVGLISAQYGGLTFARIHYMVTAKEGVSLSYDVDEIEERLVKASYSWKDSLKNELVSSLGEWEGTKKFRKFDNAFKKGYQERFTAEEALTDIDYIEEAYGSAKLGVRIYRPEGHTEDTLKIKLYNIGTPVPLSDVIPTMEDMDLRVEGEVPFTLYPTDAAVPIWIHDFQTTSRGDCAIDIEKIRENFLDLFEQVYTKRVDSDGFNRLVIRSGFDWRESMMMRAYCKYLRQLSIPFSQEYMEQILVKNPVITGMIRDMFVMKFNPDHKKDEDAVLKLYSQIKVALNKIDNLDEDKVLRRFANIVSSTLRTNFYQKDEKGLYRPYVSFKIMASKVIDMPAPRPAYEIFIYSSRFEAVHLRGGKIARGGLRWSDRREDFRTEILGLVKAQMVKNAVIVPQGAKGGFVLKGDVESMSRDEFMEEGIACYKQMISGLLEITDNLVKGAPVAPEGVVCWDESDPYLVVAADKGTATFSDIANEVAMSKDFWLGDAFASGGSQGYDHKAMAITARGAWKSVERHFWERGTDLNKSTITAIGVGDMAGDVFGNGMLLCKNLKLRVAFNHKHIFVDPDPDPAVSFKERKRMFKQRLGWDGYDEKLLSKGGAIFERKAKSLKVSNEVKAMLGLNSQNVSPSELIVAALKSEQDLLWFGGIGTFVKSRYESNADVGDRANDDIRVNAHELKCHVIGEGANLGITQKARIDFAKKGGAVNTDAIDNSAGVDCSDHEVNIKILLSDAMTHGSLNMEQRNKLLVKMTDEVADLVLKTNVTQNLALSLIRAQGPKILDVQSHLMRSMEKAGRLDRMLESLPDDAAMSDYQAAQTALTRPELSVLLPYAKNDLYETIIDSDLPDEDRLAHYLTTYFPSQIQTEYKRYITRHPLKREIIATCIVNTIVNRMGASFVHDMHEKSGCGKDDVIRAYLTAVGIYGLDEVWEHIEGLGMKLDAKKQAEALLKVWALTKRVTIWLLRHHDTLDVCENIKAYKPQADELFDVLESCLADSQKQKIDEEHHKNLELGLPDKLAKRLAKLDVVASAPDIIQISNQSKAPVSFVASTYFALGARFGFMWMRSKANKLRSNNVWHRTAVTTMVDDLYLYQANLTKKIIADMGYKKKSAEKGYQVVDKWTEEHLHETAMMDQVLAESFSMGNADLALLTVLSREARILSE